MRRMTRQSRQQKERRRRVGIFLSGGLITVALLIGALIWLDEGSKVEIPTAPVERPGRFIFYEALKQSNPDGAQVMPLIPKSLKQKQPDPSPSPMDTSTPPLNRNLQKSTTYAVQVAALRDQAAAEALTARLIQKGYPAYFLPHAVPGRGVWYRVRIGHYRDRVEARQMADRLSIHEELPGFVALERP